MNQNRKMNFKFEMLVAICLLFSGCSAPAVSYHMKAMPFDSQSLKYENNYQVVISEKPKITVVLFPLNDLLKNNDINDFYVIIDNHGYNYINFSPKNIKASCKTGNVKIFTYDESVTYFNKKNEPDLRGLGSVELSNIMALYLAAAPGLNKQEQPNFLKRQTISQGQEHRGIVQVFCERCEGNIAFDVMTPNEIHSFNFSLF